MSDIYWDWLPISEAAKALGLSKKTTRKRAQRGMLQKKTSRDGTYLYRVPILQGSSAMSNTSSSYRFNEPNDTYTFLTILTPNPLTLQGENVRKIWRNYTQGHSAKDICFRNNFSTSVFLKIRKALNLTRNSAPFPPEYIQAHHDEDLVEEDLEVRTFHLQNKIERAHRRKIDRAAQNWFDYKKSILDSLQSFNWDSPPIITRKKQSNKITSKEFVSILGTSDFHIGKREFGTCGQLSKYREFLEDLCSKGVDESLDEWGTPSEWVVIVGSDLLHSDTMAYTTTRGTPQGSQSVGSIYMQVEEALRLMANVIDYAKESANVRAVWVPGNHDELLSFTIAAALQQRYNHDPTVAVDLGQSPRKVLAFWDVPVMFTHGHNLKPKDYVSTLARSMPRGCVLEKGLIVQGHLHKNARVADHASGVDVVTLASPAISDDWHYNKGFCYNNKKMSVLKVSREQGLASTKLVKP